MFWCEQKLSTKTQVQCVRVVRTSVWTPIKAIMGEVLFLTK